MFPHLSLSLTTADPEMLAVWPYTGVKSLSHSPVMKSNHEKRAKERNGKSFSISCHYEISRNTERSQTK